METKPFDAANYLETEEDILYYLEAAMEGNGLGRQALYSALSENGNPTLETLTAVLDALGLEVTVKKRAA
jgi:DNA-binding phage protein